MSDLTVWLIIAAFYLPLHTGLPVLLAFIFAGQDSGFRRRVIVRLLIDCSISMLIAFALALMLWQQQLTLAIVILMLATIPPYIHLWWLLRQREVRQS